VLLTLLFVGSTRFTESITLSRYPEYEFYQRQTSAVVPWFPRKHLAPRENFNTN
jgi:steroid 5-alpha reductase family enzyme